VQTLTLTDIATGWTECGPLLVRERGSQAVAVRGARVRHRHRQRVDERDRQNVLRRRAGVHAVSSVRQNDQAWVEQKNGAVVGHAVGECPYEGLQAATALAVRELLPAVL